MIDDTLKDRAKVYGNYEAGVRLRADMLELITTRYEVEHGLPMTPNTEILFLDIIMKLSRLSVSPFDVDSVHDIVGYAKLWEDIAIKQSKGKTNE